MAFVASGFRGTSFLRRSLPLAGGSGGSARATWAMRGMASRRAVSMSAGLPTDATVGFLGLGVMGLPMAANLSHAFNDVVVWNRSDKTRELQAAAGDFGARIRALRSPAEVVDAADVTFCMLSTPAAVNEVLLARSDSGVHGVRDGKCVIDCSTLRVDDMSRTAEAVSQRSGRFLEAPVSGSKVPAEKGQLIFLCGGDRGLFDDAVTQRALDVMGKRALFLGDVGNGTKMKLVVNQLMATMLAALGESIVLSEALNLSVDDLLEVLSLGAMNNPMFALKGPKMAHGAKGYDTNFPLEHAQKDAGFAQELGDELGISMSVNSVANEWYKAAKGLGLSRSDFCAVIESIRSSAGRH